MSRYGQADLPEEQTYVYLLALDIYSKKGDPNFIAHFQLQLVESLRDSICCQAEEELDAINIKHPTKNIDTLEFSGIVEVELIVKTVEDNFRLEILQVNSP